MLVIVNYATLSASVQMAISLGIEDPTGILDQERACIHALIEEHKRNLAFQQQWRASAETTQRQSFLVRLLARPEPPDESPIITVVLNKLQAAGDELSQPFSVNEKDFLQLDADLKPLLRQITAVLESADLGDQLKQSDESATVVTTDRFGLRRVHARGIGGLASGLAIASPIARYSRAVFGLHLYSLSLRIRMLQSARRAHTSAHLSLLEREGPAALEAEITARQRELRDLPSVRIPTIEGFTTILPIIDPFLEERRFLTDIVERLQGANSTDGPSAIREPTKAEVQRRRKMDAVNQLYDSLISDEDDPAEQEYLERQRRDELRRLDR